MIRLLAGTFGQRSTCGYGNVLTAYIRSDICGDDLAVIGSDVLSVDNHSTVSEEVDHMHAQGARDPYQGSDASVGGTCLDLLIGGASDAGREENALLGAVLSEAGDSNAVTDGSEVAAEPVVIGRVGHLTHRVLKIIPSQPGIPGLF